MNTKRKIGKWEKLKLITFGIYNLLYVMNMAGYVGRAFNYGSLILFIIVCFFAHITKNDFNISIKFKSDLIRFLSFYGFIIIYSFIVQLINRDIQSYLFSSTLYLLLPMIIAYFWMISTDVENMDLYFYIFFIRLVLNFIIINGASLSLEAIRHISWSDSKSSIFESNIAHDFMFMTFIFLYKKKKALAILSTAFCLLSFKRISFILSIALLFLFRFISNKKCNKKLIGLLIGVTIIAPLIYGWMISANGQYFFMNKFGIDLDQLFTGRIYSINKWLAGIDTINGYGSISHYINIGKTTAGLYSLHCDLYQLYIECSIVAVILFAFFIFKFAEKNYYSLFLALYIVLELFVSQFFINLSIWMIFYMFTFMIEIEKRKNREVQYEKKLTVNNF